jgi:hypothetical protein
LHTMWRPSIGGPILLGFVIVAAILLIAGFGMPVGVGLLVGLVPGAVVGVGSGLWIGLKARGGPMSFDSYATLTSDDGPQVDLQAVTASMERVQRVDHGDLVRIVPGGATSDAGGFRVELIAVELRATGGVAHLTAAEDPPSARQVGSFARVAVEDDLGTSYAAGATGGSGSMDRSRFEVRFAPAPPAATSLLRVRIDAFIDPFGRSLAEIPGPWVLEVALASA